MIDMLLGVHVPQAALLEETSPDAVPRGPCHMPKTGHFQGVDHAVVGVGAVRDFEARRAVWLELFLIILYDPAVVRG